jgi:hypothetical protein
MKEPEDTTAEVPEGDGSDEGEGEGDEGEGEGDEGEGEGEGDEGSSEAKSSESSEDEPPRMSLSGKRVRYDDGGVASGSEARLWLRMCATASELRSFLARALGVVPPEEDDRHDHLAQINRDEMKHPARWVMFVREQIEQRARDWGAFKSTMAWQRRAQGRMMGCLTMLSSQPEIVARAWINEARWGIIPGACAFGGYVRMLRSRSEIKGKDALSEIVKCGNECGASDLPYKGEVQDYMQPDPPAWSPAQNISICRKGVTYQLSANSWATTFLPRLEEKTVKWRSWNEDLGAFVGFYLDEELSLAWHVLQLLIPFDLALIIFEFVN